MYETCGEQIPQMSVVYNVKMGLRGRPVKFEFCRQHKGKRISNSNIAVSSYDRCFAKSSN